MSNLTNIVLVVILSEMDTSKLFSYFRPFRPQFFNFPRVVSRFSNSRSLVLTVHVGLYFVIPCFILFPFILFSSLLFYSFCTSVCVYFPPTSSTTLGFFSIFFPFFPFFLLFRYPLCVLCIYSRARCTFQYFLRNPLLLRVFHLSIFHFSTFSSSRLLFAVRSPDTTFRRHSLPSFCAIEIKKAAWHHFNHFNVPGQRRK